MFTGLVQNIGTIRSLNNSKGDFCIEIETDMNLSAVQIGASICCSGCCLTVTKKSENSFYADISRETLGKTTIGSWRVMTQVNLEPSLKAGDQIGGHFVSGHVDGIAQILSIKADKSSHILEISISDNLIKYIATKGSITIDGISLTVNAVCDTCFSVNIIPHSWENTTLSELNIGDNVNIEIDILARYIGRMMEFKD